MLIRQCLRESFASFRWISLEEERPMETNGPSRQIVLPFEVPEMTTNVGLIDVWIYQAGLIRIFLISLLYPCDRF